MKKFATTINGASKDVDLNNNIVVFDHREYRLLKENDELVIIDVKGIISRIDDVIELGNNLVRIEVEGYTVDVIIKDPLLNAVSDIEDENLRINSPLGGSVSSILINTGDEITKGEVVLVISAMKMENKIIAKSNGRIKSVAVAIGDQVSKGDQLLELEVN